MASGTPDRARVILARVTIKRDQDVYHDAADDDAHDASCVRPFRDATSREWVDDEASKKKRISS